MYIEVQEVSVLIKVRKLKIFLNVLPLVSIVSGLLADLIAMVYFFNLHYRLFEGLTGMKAELYVLVIGYFLSFLGIILGLLGLIASKVRVKAMIGLLLSIAFFVILS